SFPIEVDGWTEPQPGQDLLGGFAELLPWIEGTTRIELLHLGELLGARDVSPATPTLSLDPPVPPADPGAPWSLRWTATDADGDPLSFMVLYSDDDGETWSVLTVWLTGSGLELAPGELAGSDQARIRVLVTDGVNTAEATSGIFTVPRSAPRAFILHPDADLLVAAGTPVILDGAGSDAEDGPLPDSALIWTDADGSQLGSGAGVTLRQLPAGDHTITLTATDSDGMTGTDSVRITVASAPEVHGIVSLSSDLYSAGTAPAAMVQGGPGSRVFSPRLRRCSPKNEHYVPDGITAHLFRKSTSHPIKQHCFSGSPVRRGGRCELSLATQGRPRYATL
ncbi:MAG: hypothetical protein GY856_42210, partial [bacterium]|nr:hypothetical protein [bacterium]